MEKYHSSLTALCQITLWFSLNSVKVQPSLVSPFLRIVALCCCVLELLQGAYLDLHRGRLGRKPLLLAALQLNEETDIALIRPRTG